MSDPYIGEIRMFGGTFAPVGWLMCNGALQPIQNYDVLFSLIGTTYGGDGQSTFAVPNLQSRVPIHQGNGPGGAVQLGQIGGAEQVTITQATMPAHSHPAIASTALANAPTPGANTLPGNTALATITPYGTDNPQTSLGTASTNTAYTSGAHNNIQPYLAVNFIIATEGIYPSQS
jgi:microcystin-dependent protein